jgi:hypothetical protein
VSCIFFVGILCVTFCYPISASQVLISDLIKVAKSHEKNNYVFHWQCQRKQGSYSDINKLDTIDSKGQIENYDVFFDTYRKQYNVHGNMCRLWTGGDSDYISIEVGFSFDGKTYTCWKRAKSGKVLPTEEDHGECQISRDLSDVEQDVNVFSQTNGVYQGIGFGVPGFVTVNTYDYYGAEKISEVFQQWEKKKRSISINENQENQKVEIEVRVDRIQGTDDYFLKMLYDPSTNIIEHAELFSKYNGKQYVMTIYDVEFQKDENGNRFPKLVKEIYPLDHRVILTSYSSFKTNPQLSKDIFQTTIPDGIYVTDYITKRYYKVGDIVEEDKAIDRFMQRHGLTGNVPSKTTLGGIVRYVLIGAGCLLIIIALILKILEYRGRKQ